MRDTCVSVVELLRRVTPISKRSANSRLQLQRRDDRDEIGVAAALAEAVERALDLARAGAHGGERIGHRLLGVVMGMDADMIAGDLLDHLADDRLDLVRQRAAIGVAQHHPARAGVIGGLGAGQRDSRDWPCSRRRNARSRAAPRGPAAFAAAHAVADRGEIFLVAWSRARRARDSPRTLATKQMASALASSSAASPGSFEAERPGRARHAEGGEGARSSLRLVGEQLGVGRVGAGIAALDIVDAELVEHAGDRQLVVQREIDAVGLRAVAQRGVEQIEAFAAHCRALPACAHRPASSASWCWRAIRR